MVDTWVTYTYGGYSMALRLMVDTVTYGGYGMGP